MTTVIPTLTPTPASAATPASIDLRQESLARSEFELMGRLRLARTLRSRNEAPVLRDEAFHGLAGQIVKTAQPLTEANPAAMLFTLLTTFGALVGRGSFVSVGPEQHFPILFSLIIGPSGSGKGVSLAAVRPVLAAADHTAAPFLKTRLVKGFQSGEALVQTAVDLGLPASSASGALEPSGSSPDQRLLVVESEYAKMLTVAQRQGSILSTILRAAWDGESLECRTRREKLVSTDAHIGVVGHVTPEELRSKLDLVDIANGFANRFLPVWSAPHQYMHTPGAMPPALVAEFGGHLRSAIDFGQAAGEIGRSTAFTDAWATLYYVLKFRPTGGPVFSSLTARAHAHILRLAMVYALLDESQEIDLSHLRAATALWDYCEATVAHVWGATLGSERLDRLLAAVTAAGDGGLTRTDISGLFSNNVSKSDLDALARRLVDMGLARAESQPTGGRPRDVLIAAEL